MKRLAALVLLATLPPAPSLADDEARANDGEQSELIRTQLKIAELYEAKNDIDRAVGALRELLAQHPDNELVLERTGRLAHQHNRSALVLRVAPALVRRHPGRTRYRIWLATALVATGRRTDALPHLQWLQTRQPNDPGLREELAAAHEQMKHPRQALEHYDWLVARSPRNTTYRLARSHLYGDINQPGKQRGELEAVLAIDPRHAEARLALAELAYHEERFDEAEAQLRRVSAAAPAARALLAKIHAARKRARRRAAMQLHREERYRDWLRDLQERSEDF